MCAYPSHLILCDELALPECVWHVVDWQSQVVCAVFKVQSLWFIQELPSHLGLHLKNLLHRTPRNQTKHKNNYFKLPSWFFLLLHLAHWAIYFSHSIRKCWKPFNLSCIISADNSASAPALMYTAQRKKTWNTWKFSLRYVSSGKSQRLCSLGLSKAQFC